MSLVINFYYTSSMLNMFRTLIHPSSGACDSSIVSPHWSCVLVSMCVVFSVWLVWGGIRVAGWSTTCCASAYAQHVSDINTYIIRSLRLFYCITTSCVLVSMCVGVSVWLGWGGIRVGGWSRLQPATRIPPPDDGCINVRNILSIEEVK